MKLGTFILFVSLTANAALLMAAFVTKKNQQESSVPVTTSPVSGENSVHLENSAPAFPTHEGSGSGAQAEGKRKIYHDDPVVFARNLRDAGFPEVRVRALVNARLLAEYSKREADIVGEQKMPYWKRPGSSGYTAEQSRLLQEVRNEMSSIRRAVDPNYDGIFDSPEWASRLIQKYGPVPEAKLRALAKLEDEIEANELPITDIESAEAFEEMRTKRDAEVRRKLEALLSPTELHEYDLRSSPTARHVRRAFATLDLSEEEYRAIYALEAAQKTGREPDSRSSMDVRGVALDPAQKEYQAALKSALGEARYRELEIISQPSNQRVARLMKRLNLPITTVVEAENIRNDIAQRAKLVSQNSSLSREQQMAQYQALAAEAKSALSQKLGGPQGFEEYVKIKDSWLNDLQSGRVGK